MTLFLPVVGAATGALAVVPQVEANRSTPDSRSVPPPAATPGKRERGPTGIPVPADTSRFTPPSLRRTTTACS
ncbi:MAG TPA: hypothetical protein VNO31_25115, partial [Umezawaea sp.]|nr:hypothetical protein [Umezawaea sp.]